MIGVRQSTGRTVRGLARALVVVSAVAAVTESAPAQQRQNAIQPRQNALQPRQNSLQPRLRGTNSGGPPPVEVRRLIPDEATVNAVEVRPEVRESARRLASAEYADREAAMNELLGGTARLEELCAMLAKDELSTEQRTRLLFVIRERLRGAPRGAVGIRMMWRQEQPRTPGAVEVTDLLPGLPAEQVLEVGDQIERVDGVALNTSEDLIVLVQSKRPGDAVKLNVRRAHRDDRGDLVIDDSGRVAYDPIEVLLRLGSVSQLQQTSNSAVSPVEERRMREAMEAIWRYDEDSLFIPVQGAHESGLIVAGPDTPTTDVEVAAARLLRDLEVDLALGVEGQIVLTPERRAEWARDLGDLQSWSEDPTLTERERTFVSRMVKRFIKQMP